MLGERLRVARARAQLSMADVAKECGCTAQAVMKWEHDRAMPDSRKLLKLCGLLDISLEWIMDPDPLDFHSTERAPQGRHAKYWAREAIAEMRELGLVIAPEGD
ncbi:helix-turn-helix domain-containing protein [Ruegeria sp. HKCCD6109]|nr:helix-turn-helix transcriptional regulator [Ruegeria sp. HKCCD6109]NOD65767.1 helix-turn-helix domain-containing protein [Ruegeria sp. HKCCD6109]